MALKVASCMRTLQRRLQRAQFVSIYYYHARPNPTMRCGGRGLGSATQQYGRRRHYVAGAASGSISKHRLALPTCRPPAAPSAAAKLPKTKSEDALVPMPKLNSFPDLNDEN